ncbi:hypothetical protein STEG23_017844 [Scotinomys teguina]
MKTRCRLYRLGPYGSTIIYTFFIQNQTFQNFAENYFTSFIVHDKFPIKINFLPASQFSFRDRNLLIMKYRRIGSAYQNDETEHTSAKSIMYIAEMYY